MLRRSLLPAFIAAVLALAAPAARAQADAGAFANSLAQKVIDGLTVPGLSDEERARRFRVVFTDGFDVPLIARFVLGRYWRVATEAERAEYLRLFDELIVTTYSRRFAEFPGAQFKVVSVSKPNEDGDQIVSIDGTIPAKSPVRLDARVRPTDGRFKIIDIALEGVSMAITQRDEFGAVIQRGGGQMNALLANLREKTSQR